MKLLSTKNVQLLIGDFKILILSKISRTITTFNHHTLEMLGTATHLKMSINRTRTTTHAGI